MSDPSPKSAAVLNALKSLGSKPVKATIHAAKKNTVTTALIILLVVTMAFLFLCMLSYGIYAFVRKPDDDND